MVFEIVGQSIIKSPFRLSYLTLVYLIKNVFFFFSRQLVMNIISQVVKHEQTDGVVGSIGVWATDESKPAVSR